jgi:hypothetical protein
VKRALKHALAALALLASAALHAAEGPATPRAIWTWEEDSYAMLQEPARAGRAIAFLRAKSVDTVFLYADALQGRNLIESDPALYLRLLRRMHAAGLKVYALLGSGYLHTERYVLPEQHKDAVAMLQRVLDYNRTAAPEERFDGVNVDIEPHILDAWPARKMELLKGFLDMSDALMRSVHASGQALPVGPAIPFWLDGITLEWKGAHKPVSQHTQDIYDYVALMDYRDRAAGGDGIVSHAMDELRYGGAIGKKVLIGVETLPNAIKKVSFYHLAESDLKRELGATRAAVGDMPAYGGFVVHHYGSYRKWLGLD